MLFFVSFDLHVLHIRVAPALRPGRRKKISPEEEGVQLPVRDRTLRETEEEITKPVPTDPSLLLVDEVITSKVVHDLRGDHIQPCAPHHCH
jgi:hypothetical protein